MSLEHPAIIQHSDEPKIRFGLTKPDTYGRVAIYTSVYVHVTPQRIGPEVSFVHSETRGIVAVMEDVAEITCKVVDAISPYAIDPYGPHIPIRVTESDIPGYASKIVFYLKRDEHLDDVYKALAKAMYTHVNATRTSLVEGERPSAKELRARFKQGFPFDYNMI